MVIGAGAGIGGNVAKRFAKEGFHSVLCRRSNQHGLDDLIRGIEEEGGTASGFLINVVEPESIEECVEKVENDIGPIETLVFNLGAQVGNKSLSETTYKIFELGWRLATFSLFRTASSVLPKMENVEKVPFSLQHQQLLLGVMLGSILMHQQWEVEGCFVSP